jgi:pilus assembly protein CpaE
MPDSRLGDPSRALLVSPDPRMVSELGRLLATELPLTSLTVFETYPSPAALSELAASGMLLCFLDVASDQETAFAAMFILASFCPEVPVFALLRSNDPDLILQCLRRGASEFLIQPFTADQFRAALAKVSRFHPSRATESESRARVYCVMPGKGACGATTVACHLAYALKRQGGSRILLADMDGLTGTLAFLLKLKSSYSFVDALAHAGSLDADLWKALVVPCQGVDVLLSPENPVDGIGDVADPAPILDYSRRVYDAVVLDTGGVYGDWNLSLARMCDDLLLVTTNELAALHAVLRAHPYLRSNGADWSKTRLVVNRYSDAVGLRRESIETALQSGVFETLPSDCEAIQRSLMEGKPVPSESRFGKGIARLAQHLAGGQRAGEKRSFLSGFLKKLTGRPTSPSADSLWR